MRLSDCRHGEGRGDHFRDHQHPIDCACECHVLRCHWCGKVTPRLHTLPTDVRGMCDRCAQQRARQSDIDNGYAVWR
jgi:hypothetical protein